MATYKMQDDPVVSFSAWRLPLEVRVVHVHVHDVCVVSYCFVLFTFSASSRIINRGVYRLGSFNIP